MLWSCALCRAVLWGRSVFNSIRKFLQFQLTVNFVALVVAFVGAIIGGRIPLNVLQVGSPFFSNWHTSSNQCRASVREIAYQALATYGVLQPCGSLPILHVEE